MLHPVSVVLEVLGKVLYKGNLVIDTLIDLLPKEGDFTIVFDHTNKRGFAKVLALYNAFGKKLGIRVNTALPKGCSWPSVAANGIGLPQSPVSITFSNRNTAIVFLFSAQIPCGCPGNWKLKSTDSANFDYMLDFCANNFTSAAFVRAANPFPRAAKGGESLTALSETIIAARKAMVLDYQTPSKVEKVATAKPTKVATAKPAKVATTKPANESTARSIREAKKEVETLPSTPPSNDSPTN